MIRVYVLSAWITAVFCVTTALGQSTSKGVPALPETNTTAVPPTPTPQAREAASQGLTNFSGPANTSLGVPAQSGLSQDLRIRSGDLLHVSVFGATEFDSEVRVAENGSVTLPLLDQVLVAGMTAAQFTQDLKNRLVGGGYFNDPLVSVTIKEYAAEGVSVLGEVQKPGIYPFRGPNRLFDLISAAGGTTALAGNKVTITHRERPEQPETVALTFGEQGARQSNVTVAPGDTIIFEKAGVVYVVGDVRKPTGIVMTNPDLTVLQALAMAEGANRGAALGKAKLIRKTAQGAKEVPLPLNKMLAAQTPDIQVQANDIIFVPSSAAKSAAKRGVEAAISAATMLAIYRP